MRLFARQRHESSARLGGELKMLSQQLGQLLGGPALAQLNLADRDIGAAHPLPQLLLRKVERLAILLESSSE
jgi:hypothetical protein